ncbi:MAG: hypothetical protein KGI25_03875 [Thaumarchaeota archaeon]|nr:hypothetical protein [Nitrososphaerota archaeon]
MYLSNRFSISVLSRIREITEISTFLAMCGSTIMLLGGIWDSASHELRIPDTFWTVQHLTIYSGASMVACSAIAAGLVLNQHKNKKMKKGMMMILFGAILQLGGGYADYNFHEIYGIDGLVTPSHLSIETGLLLSSTGSFIMLSKSQNQVLLKMAPVSIVSVLLSLSWIGFNLVLLGGAVVLCVPVFQLFYSGCALM